MAGRACQGSVETVQPTVHLIVRGVSPQKSSGPSLGIGIRRGVAGTSSACRDRVPDCQEHRCSPEMLLRDRTNQPRNVWWAVEAFIRQGLEQMCHFGGGGLGGAGGAGGVHWIRRTSGLSAV